MTQPNSNVLLDVKNLTVYFYTKRGIVHAVEDVSFFLKERESLGIVGESGSGKSVTSRSVMRLTKDPGHIEAGEVFYNGEDVLKMSDARIRQFRGGDVAMVFQEPLSSLNPSFTIGWQIGEAFRLHTNLSKAEIREKTLEVLRDVKIADPERQLRNYPHQLSGGMRQRVLIAIALACNARILIADEPTTALDVTVQAEIMDLIEELQEKKGMSVLLISHNLKLVSERCKRIIVMYAGQIVEMANTDDILSAPLHPYTQGLLRAIPNQSNIGKRLVSIPGDVPVITQRFTRCAFSDRCAYVSDACLTANPELKELKPGHFCRCIKE